MIIQQALFGYSNGHHLLSSSINISATMLKVLEPLSDLSGSDFQEGFLEYLTGYFFDQEEYFALSKTWYAVEMNRPGCVWTHTLLISFGDLDKLPKDRDFNRFFCRPSIIGRYDEYKKPIVIEPEIYIENNEASSHGNNIKTKKLLSAIFESQRPVIIGANAASEYDNVFFALWKSLGNSVLNGESFCTGSLSNRIVNKKPLDFQVVPINKVKNIFRTIQTGVILDDIKSEEYEWINLIISNFIDHEDKKLITFLESMSLKACNRFFVKSCAKILSTLKNDSTASPSTILESISPELTLIEKKNIFNQTIFKMLSDSDRIFNIHFSEIKILEYLSTMSATELDIVAQDKIIGIIEKLLTKVADLPSELFAFLINNEINSLGENAINSLSEFAYETDLENVTGPDMKGSDILVRVKPELAYSRKIWCGSKSEQLSVLDALKSSNCKVYDNFDRKLSYTILETSTENISEGLYDTFGSKIVRFFLDWSQVSFDSSKIERWINLCKYDMEYCIDFLSLNNNEIIAKSFIRLIDPYSNLVMNMSSEYWVNFYRKYVANCYDNEYRIEFARLILPAILKSEKMYPEDVAFFAFNSIHLLLSKDNFDYDEWRRLSQLLPEIAWNNNWDKCKRLRKAAKRSGYGFKLKI